MNRLKSTAEAIGLALSLVALVVLGLVGSVVVTVLTLVLTAAFMLALASPLIMIVWLVVTL